MEFDSILSLYVDKRAEHRWGGLGGSRFRSLGKPGGRTSID
jgi:hypothetical protein